MTTVGALLIMAVVSILAVVFGFVAGLICAGYSMKIRQVEGLKAWADDIVTQINAANKVKAPQPPETEVRVQ